MDKEILEELFELRKFKETIESDGAVVITEDIERRTYYFSKDEAMKKIGVEIHTMKENQNKMLSEFHFSSSDLIDKLEIEKNTLQVNFEDCQENFSKMSLFDFWQFKRKYKDDRKSPINIQ